MKLRDGMAVVVKKSTGLFKGNGSRWYRTGIIIGQSDLNPEMWRIEFNDGSTATIHEDDVEKGKEK